MMLLSGRDEQGGDFRYAPEKMEREGGSRTHLRYRASLRLPCPAHLARRYHAARRLEQDDYVRNGPFANRPLADLVEDFIAVRRATLSLLRNLDESAGCAAASLTKTRSACAASRTSSPDMNCIIAEFWRRNILPGASCLAEKRRIVVIRSAASCHPDRGKLSSRRIIVIPSGARTLVSPVASLKFEYPIFPCPHAH